MWWRDDFIWCRIGVLIVNFGQVLERERERERENEREKDINRKLWEKICREKTIH